MNPGKSLRLAAIGVALALPVALQWRNVLLMANRLNASRMEKLAPALLDPAGFGFWTAALGLMLHACLCWMRRPSWPRLLYLALTIVGLGSLTLFGCAQILFFSMPGNGM